MDKLQELEKQAEKIQQYGINEGYSPNDSLFSLLSYAFNGILDLSEHGYDEVEVVDLIILVQDEVLRLLMDDYGFSVAVGHAFYRYKELTKEVGEHHEGKL